jgi:hypothetical protein
MEEITDRYVPLHELKMHTHFDLDYTLAEVAFKD